jgi:hypothetical protein
MNTIKVFIMIMLLSVAVIIPEDSKAAIFTDYFIGTGVYSGSLTMYELNYPDSANPNYSLYMPGAPTTTTKNAIVIGSITIDSTNNYVHNIMFSLYDYSKRYLAGGWTYSANSNTNNPKDYDASGSAWSENYGVYSPTGGYLGVSRINNVGSVNYNFNAMNFYGYNQSGFSSASESFNSNNLSYSALPVDINAFTPTPIPAGAWLLGSGLAGLVGLRRKRQI